MDYTARISADCFIGSSEPLATLYKFATRRNAMSALLHTRPKFDVPRRKKEVVEARPEFGKHEEQVDQAFAITFERSERAIEELAKR